MLDILYLMGVMLFFALSIGMIYALEKLKD
jgi:hypothetical protein